MISTPSLDLPYYYKQVLGFFADYTPAFLEIIRDFVGLLIGLSIPLSILLLVGIVISVEGIKHIRRLEEEKFNVKAEPAYIEDEADTEMAIRWRKVMEHADSSNQNDWKQAILEADVMLDALLIKLGYQGGSIGERLQRVQKGDFKSLNQAWEAHKVRNMIAHDGSDFTLNQVEARRVIGLYRQVFDEFYHIA